MYKVISESCADKEIYREAVEIVIKLYRHHASDAQSSESHVDYPDECPGVAKGFLLLSIKI